MVDSARHAITDVGEIRAAKVCRDVGVNITITFAIIISNNHRIQKFLSFSHMWKV